MIKHTTNPANNVILLMTNKANYIILTHTAHTQARRTPKSLTKLAVSARVDMLMLACCPPAAANPSCESMGCCPSWTPAPHCTPLIRTPPSVQNTKYKFPQTTCSLSFFCTFLPNEAILILVTISK